MNFYNILNVPQNATKSEIRKAYHKLVLLYHPDKCSNNDSIDKFHQIQTAYEILCDDAKRKEYDDLTFDQQNKIYNFIKGYFTQMRPEYLSMYNSMIDFVYEGGEDDFKNDANNLNIKNFLGKIIDRIISIHNIKIFNIEDNVSTMQVSLKDKYNNKPKNIRIGENNYIIPIHKTQVVVNDSVKGNVVINIICETDPNYKIIDDYNLFCVKVISLSQYIYGGRIKIYDVNLDILWLDFDTCLEKKPIFVIKNKGLPFMNSYDDAAQTMMMRGDLLVYLLCDGVNSYGNKVVDEYSGVVEDIVKLLFPAIE